jgi:hypothetical protein
LEDEALSSSDMELVGLSGARGSVLGMVAVEAAASTEARACAW